MTCCSPQSVLGTISYKGRVSEDLYQIIRKNKEFQSINIQSEGGDAIFGMLILNELIGKSFDLTINSYCISACANVFVFASDEIFLKKDAFILFHNSTGEVVRTYKREGYNVGPVLSYTAILTDSLYDEIGKPQVRDILERAMNRTEVSRIDTTECSRYGLIPHSSCAVIYGESLGWVPSPEQLRNYGFKVGVEGEFVSWENVNRTLVCEFGETLRLKIYYIDELKLIDPSIEC
jgi:ATP-dependent protease ClpP protease subunit